MQKFREIMKKKNFAATLLLLNLTSATHPPLLSAIRFFNAAQQCYFEMKTKTEQYFSILSFIILCSALCFCNTWEPLWALDRVCYRLKRAIRSFKKRERRIRPIAVKKPYIPHFEHLVLLMLWGCCRKLCTSVTRTTCCKVMSRRNVVSNVLGSQEPAEAECEAGCFTLWLSHLQHGLITGCWGCQLQQVQQAAYSTRFGLLFLWAFVSCVPEFLNFTLAFL